MQSELKCRACSNSYHKSNLPRLLTMCGHTFCESCIKSMISKKKDSQYKIQCPIDKKVLTLPHNKPSFFPKNVSLIKVVQISQQSTILIPDENNSFLDSRGLTSYNLKSSYCNNTLEQSLLFSEPKQLLLDLKQNESQMCLLHNKKAQIFCIDDNCPICSTCAIFGTHKGHKFKDISQIEYLCKKTAEDMVAIMQRKKRMLSKISNSSLKDDIFVILAKKKQKIKKQIQECYAKLLLKVHEAHKKKIQQLQQINSNIIQDIDQLLSFDEIMISQYDNWEQVTKQKLVILKKGQLEAKIDLLYNCKGNAEAHIKKGLYFIRNMKNKEQNLFRNVQQTIEKLTYQVKNQKYQQPFSLIKLQKQVYFPESNLKISSFKTVKSLVSIEKSEIGLKSSSPVPRKSVPIQDNSSSLTLQSSEFLKIQSTASNRGLTSSRTYASVFKNNNKTPIGCKQKALSRMSSASKLKDNFFKSKVSKIKNTRNFERVIDGVINDTLEIVDLTNASLQDNQVKQIIQHIQQKPKSIKLSRNNLTDEGFRKIIPYLKNIFILNLSNNALTDTTINILNDNLDNLSNLKSIVLSQNKIMERKHKQTIEKWRKAGIAVSI